MTAKFKPTKGLSTFTILVYLGCLSSSSSYLTFSTLRSVGENVAVTRFGRRLTLSETNTANGDDEKEEMIPNLKRISAREARIRAPLSLILGSLSLDINVAEAASRDDAFQESLARFFPGALTNSAIMLRVTPTLRKRGYQKSNTLLGSSICSDEINSTPNSVIASLQRQFTTSKDGGVFNLGGLGGVPFVGTSGFNAFLGHCPDQGKVILYFGPHVGISDKGLVGKVERVGQAKASAACGALVGGYNAVIAGAPGSKSSPLLMDLEEDSIIKTLKGKLGRGAKDKDGKALSMVTNIMYDTIHDQIIAQMERCTAKSGFWDKISEVTLLGGIIINRGHGSGVEGGDDFFQPLTMKTLVAQGEINLYEEVFGDLPTPRNYDLL